ncbi:substrate-binding domain-containing protein [Microbacterium hibisci]|uniref:substrate-binding domain-containing protein n=1 Tax=Microbacterium hibisci TaxID=2036000 RepID=UPI003556668E
MSNSLPRARHEHILRHIELHGTVSATGVAQELGVSPMTIRRDMDELEEAGRLVRVHGGAIAATAPPVPQSALTNIGVVVPGTVGHFPMIIRGMDAASHALRARLVLATSQYHPDVERRQAERLVEAGVKGLILAPTLREQTEEELADWVRQQPVPVVFLERRLESTALASFDSVRSDHARGAVLAVEHLHRLGHERVGIALLERTATAPLIREGYARAIERLGMESAPYRALPKRDEEHDARLDVELAAFIDECLESGTTAALVHTDVEAARIVELAVDRGLRIPDDLALVAYDDNTAAFALVPLSAVTAPRRDLGGEALSTVMHRVSEAGDADRAPRNLAILPRLTVRESCGARA